MMVYARYKGAPKRKFDLSSRPEIENDLWERGE